MNRTQMAALRARLAEKSLAEPLTPEPIVPMNTTSNEERLQAQHDAVCSDPECKPEPQDETAGYKYGTEQPLLLCEILHLARNTLGHTRNDSVVKDIEAVLFPKLTKTRKRHYVKIIAQAGSRVETELLYLDKKGFELEWGAMLQEHARFRNIVGPFRTKDIAQLFSEQYPHVGCVADATRMYNKQRELLLKESLRDE